MVLGECHQYLAAVNQPNGAHGLSAKENEPRKATQFCLKLDDAMLVVFRMAPYSEGQSGLIFSSCILNPIGCRQ
jgi:hypothetical protein